MRSPAQDQTVKFRRQEQVAVVVALRVLDPRRGRRGGAWLPSGPHGPGQDPANVNSVAGHQQEVLKKDKLSSVTEIIEEEQFSRADSSQEDKAGLCQPLAMLEYKTVAAVEFMSVGQECVDTGGRPRLGMGLGG